MTAEDLLSRLRAAMPTHKDMMQNSALAARRMSRESIRALDKVGPTMVLEEDHVVAGAEGPLPARLFVPETATMDGQTQRGGLVFFHGGGFVVDGIETHAGLCRHLAHAAGCRLVSVEYRLAPEHAFPAAYNDALAAWADIVARAEDFGLDASRLAVGGDSAGGNLAAGVAIAGRDGVVPAPLFHLLLYPWLQLGDTGRSRAVFKEGFFASEAVMNFCRDAYLGTSDRVAQTSLTHDVRVSPLYAQDLRGLPPCHVVTVGWDPLKHDADVWAERLRAAHVPVTQAHYDGLAHGSLSLPGLIKQSKEALIDAGAHLKKALSE